MCSSPELQQLLLRSRVLAHVVPLLLAYDTTTEGAQLPEDIASSSAVFGLPMQRSNMQARPSQCRLADSLPAGCPAACVALWWAAAGCREASGAALAQHAGDTGRTPPATRISQAQTLSAMRLLVRGL